MEHPRQLPIPQLAIEDVKALEILRVWAAGGQQQVSINTSLWRDPANWGIMIVDLARHVASAYSDSGVCDRATALDRLREGFDAEWNSPTDIPSSKA